MLKETFEQKKKRALKMLMLLKKHNPNAHTSLKYGNVIQFLVAVILSAQTTDKQVNKVTATLFKKYKTVNDFSNANLRTFQKEIQSIGFFRNKAKNIITACRMIRDIYSGKVPHTMEEMIALPGVGRKTASIVLGGAFGVIEGIAVDTHVARLSRHFGWTKEEAPGKIENDLMKLFPKKYWGEVNHLLVDYGRTICTARKCACESEFNWEGVK